MSQLPLPELERHLWGAADLLRGSIDSGDFKHYIFGSRSASVSKTSGTGVSRDDACWKSSARGQSRQEDS